MAMIECNECGNLISDQADACPHCGYPVGKTRNAQIDRRNRQYNKTLNRNRLLLNILIFLVTFVEGLWMFIGDVEVWQWVLYFAVLAVFLWLCFSRIPYIIAFFAHVSQRYIHLTRASYLIAAVMGFVIGGCVGMGA